MSARTTKGTSPWRRCAACTRPPQDGTILKQRADPLDDIIDRWQRLIVPKTNDAVAETLKIFSSSQIVVRHLHVLRAVKFNDQQFLGCAEISEVRTDRKLPAEFYAVYLSASETIPEFPLRFRPIASELSRPVSAKIVVSHDLQPKPQN
jgi:hypothetical protein